MGSLHWGASTDKSHEIGPAIRFQQHIERRLPGSTKISGILSDQPIFEIPRSVRRSRTGVWNLKRFALAPATGLFRIGLQGGFLDEYVDIN
jgi:hypothetical protein